MKDATKKKYSQITWPASTMDGEPRSREKILDIVNNLDNLTHEEKKGIRERSLLLDLPNFDFTLDSPAEYLHSMCLGLNKKLTELTFNTGGCPRLRNTDRKLSDPATFNLLMLGVKTPREFSRRIRELDFSVYKGAEFRNLALFFFIFVIECIEQGRKERQLWLWLAYMIRSSTIPDNEFNFVDKNLVQACCRNFYVTYEELFSCSNCTYNTHVVCSHLDLMRVHGPLTYTSTFCFESFYGEMRHSFVPGTASPMKQVLQKILLKRALKKHVCQIPIFYCAYETSLENNTLIYCWEENKHKMYVIKDIIDAEHFQCNEITTMNATFDEVPDLDWSKVGVYKKGELINDDCIVSTQSINGKVIEVGNYLLTCPINILVEK